MRKTRKQKRRTNSQLHEKAWTIRLTLTRYLKWRATLAARWKPDLQISP